MKITFQRDKFLAAFQVAAAVVPSRSPKEILKNVRIEATKAGAVLTSTDLEVGIRIEVEGVETKQPGIALLPTERIGPILRESSDLSMRIESDASGTVVYGDRSEFNLPVEDPAEFPQSPAFSESSYIELPSRVLKEAIRRTVFATDPESARYALGGVYFEFDEKSTTAVATDGRRLARAIVPSTMTGRVGGEGATIVPSRSLNIIDRALADGDVPVRIMVRQNDLLVQSDRTTIYTRLLEGRFPKWREVIPSRTDGVRMQIVVGPFFSAVRQAAIVADKESKGIVFTFGEGKVALAGKSSKNGKSRLEMPVEYSGAPVAVVMDNTFVSEFLRVLSPEGTFTLDLEDGEAAVLFQVGEDYSYVVMPLAPGQ